MEKSQYTHINSAEEVEPNNYFRMILRELVEKIPELEKEKYSNILFDFLGPYKASSSFEHIWFVDAPLDQITSARFECKMWGNLKECTLITVNKENFDGDVRFHLYERDQGRVEIHIRSLYVADHKPRISGKLIVNLVKKMTDSRPGAVATLNDASNVKILALLTTGKSYYEHLGFHYVNTDGTRKANERENFQKNIIIASVVLDCMSLKMDERMQIRRESFIFREQRLRKESIKQGILGALGAEVGKGSRLLEDFWKIYRNVMKNVDFCFLQKKYNFKTYIFTRYLRECLLAQIKIDEEIFDFSEFGGMRYS